MNHVQKFVRSWDGLKINYNVYTSSQRPDPTAVVFLVHGFGEHSGRYSHVVEELVRVGFHVHTIDLRGHGMSGGARADGVFSDFIQDLRVVWDLVADTKAPKIIYGHSMGGLLVLAFALKYQKLLPIDGVVATSPLLQIHPSLDLPIYKRLALKAAGSMLDQVLLTSQIDPYQLTSVESEVEKVFFDRMSLPFMTVKLARALLAASASTASRASELNIPLYIVHGAEDTVTYSKASEHFANSCRTATLDIIPFGLHELHNDTMQKEVLSKITTWIERRAQEAVTGSLSPPPKRRGARNMVPVSGQKRSIIICILSMLLARRSAPGLLRRFSVMLAMYSAYQAYKRGGQTH